MITFYVLLVLSFSALGCQCQDQKNFTPVTEKIKNVNLDPPANKTPPLTQEQTQDEWRKYVVLFPILLIVVLAFVVIPSLWEGCHTISVLEWLRRRDAGDEAEVLV